MTDEAGGKRISDSHRHSPIYLFCLSFSYFDAEYSFQLYSGGIYTGGDCTSNINHASECQCATHRGNDEIVLDRQSQLMSLIFTLVSLKPLAVTAVGYTWTGSSATSYWLIKNSCESQAAGILL